MKYKGFRVAIIQLEIGILVVDTNVEKKMASGEGGTEGIGAATSPSQPAGSERTGKWPEEEGGNGDIAEPSPRVAGTAAPRSHGDIAEPSPCVSRAQQHPRHGSGKGWGSGLTQSRSYTCGAGPVREPAVCTTLTGPSPPRAASFRGRTLCLDLSELDVGVLGAGGSFVKLKSWLHCGRVRTSRWTYRGPT